MSEASVPVAEAEAAVNRVLQSPEFASAARLSSFLRHVATETMAGRAGNLKGYSIAVDVFGRSPDFDQSSDPIVRVEASRLRRALAQYYHGSGAADPVLVGLPRGGYVPTFQWRDTGEQSRPAEPEEPEGDEEEANATAPAAVFPDDPPALSPAVRQFRALVLAGISLILIGLGFLVWDAVMRQPAAPVEAVAAPAPSAPPRVAVQPLTAGNRDDEAFAIGLATQMVAELARFREIAVFEFDPTAQPLRSGYLLGGNVERAGADIRVYVRLSDALSGQIVWSDDYARRYDLEAMLAIQEDIARSVAIAVAQPYGAVYEREQVNASTRPGTMDGYTCVLGAYEYWRSLDPAAHNRVRDCLERTVELEPNYADAWQALTFVYLDEYRYSYNLRAPEAHDPREKALATAQRAVALSPTDARSFQALYSAYFYRKDDPAFLRAGREALARNPNNPEIIADFGGKMAFSGRWDEGLPLVRRAMVLNPAHPGWYYISLVLDAYRRAAYDEAIALTRRMNMPNHYRTQVFLAMAYGQLGDAGHAADALSRLLTLAPDFAHDARGEFTRWGVEAKLIDLCIAGLVKAGLQPQG